MSDSISGNVAQQDSVEHAIEELLVERQQMLVLFCRLAGLDPADRKEEYFNLLQSFCEVLVDYSALWHFEIYDRIVNEKERFGPVAEAAEGNNSKILEACDVAVAFNDKYDPSDHELTFDELNIDLSRLGEEIAVRVEAEDKVIGAMQAL